MTLRIHGLLTLLIASFTPVTQGAPLPAEAFGSIPRMTDVELSPSGSRIAYVDNSVDAQKVVMLDLDAGKVLRVHNFDPQMKLRRLVWADDETLLMDLSLTHGATSTDRYEFLRTLAIDVSGGEARMLLMQGGGTRSAVTSANLLAWRTLKPKTVIMATLDFSSTKYKSPIGSRLVGGRKDSGWVARLFEVDTRTGKGAILEEGTSFTSDWVVGSDGQAVARSEWDPDTRVYRVLAKQNRSWTEIHRQEDGGQLDLYGLTADGKSIVAIGAIGQGNSKAWRVPLDGSGAKLLLDDSTLDVEHIVRDRFSGAPVGAWLGGDVQQMHWFDEKMAGRSKALLKSFPGKNVQIYGRSENNQRVLARVETPSVAPVYYFIDFTKRTADIVGEEFPALVDAKLGEVRSISYAARDGAAIPAYLTLPPGAEEKKLPLVVLPHGGPESRDNFAFDWWAQFLATRGYAVLQPQFRGSTGFGEAHRKAGYRQWGRLMQDDITDGVKSLITQGLVDAKRVCIVGASYGGYAALAGAAFTPDLYACAASVGGVSDLPGMLGYVQRRSGAESNSLAYWREHIGSAFDEKVIAASPARAASKIVAPVLLIHGVDDTVVPISQSESMAKALQDAGKPHSLVKLPGEDHWLSRSVTRTRVLKELETFLAAHLH